MKKLLTFLVFSLLGVASTVASDLIVNATVSPGGMGQVTLENTGTCALLEGEKNVSTTTNATQKSSSCKVVFSIKAKVKVTASELSETDYYFAGWTGDLTQSGASKTFELDHGAANKTYNITANFKPYWDVTAGTLIASNNVNGNLQMTSADVVFGVHGASSVSSATLVDGTLAVGNNFQLSSVTTNTEGKFVIKVSYIGTALTIDDVRDKTINVKITTNNNRTKTIPVSIVEQPSLIFLASPYGTYAIPSFDNAWDGTSNKQVMIEAPEQLINVPVSLSTDIKADGYIFFGWRVTDKTGSKIVSYADDLTYTFENGSATVEAVFVPNSCVYLIMKDPDNKSNLTRDVFGALALSKDEVYVDLHEATMVANELYTQTGTPQFVVFDNMKTCLATRGFTYTTASKREKPYEGTEGTLANREGGYTIPYGVTLFIPANDMYSYCLGDLDKLHFAADATQKVYRKLKVATDTKIQVDGNICIFAICSYTQGSNGTPNVYGQIELDSRAHINVNTGGGLYSYGYVTNPVNANGTPITDETYEQFGHVTINTGARVYEMFQMSDWRGGSATSSLVGNANKVFPAAQYYVQSVEAPLTCHHGAEERLITCANITLVGDVIVPCDFILPVSNSSSAFLKLGAATSVTKYYDYHEDRVHILLTGHPTVETPQPTATISDMNLNVQSFDLASSQYVLPIPNNMDVRLQNAIINIPYDLCALAGSSLTVDANAKVVINGNGRMSNIYFYDREWNWIDGMGTVSDEIGDQVGKGYYASTNKTLVRLKERPGGFKSPRRVIDTDAKLEVNGFLEIGQNGALYTTKDKEGLLSVDQYGANITSTGNGRIKFTNVGTATETYQVQHEKTFIKIPISSARLKNADGTFEKTSTNDGASTSAAGKTFMYIDGKWQVPDWIIPTIEITYPTYVFEDNVEYPINAYDKRVIWNATLTAGKGFTFDGSSVNTTITYSEDMGNNIRIPIRYTAQNIQGEHKATLTLTNSKDASMVYSTEISATETYVPLLAAEPVAPDAITIPFTYIGTDREVSAGTGQFAINTTPNNVTSLLSDENTELYKNITWTYSTNDPQFRFVFGEGREALSKAKIVYSPNSVGDHSTEIKITATYKDANGSNHSNVEEVKLLVNAKTLALESNNFDFSQATKEQLDDLCVNKEVQLVFNPSPQGTSNIQLSFENNEVDGNPIIVYEGDGITTPFVIKATAVPAEMPTIIVKQESDGVYEEHTIEYKPNIQNCYPDIDWNWEDMYFGESYDNPITSNSEGVIHLTLKKVVDRNGNTVNANSIMTYDPSTLAAVIKSGLSDEYVATFSFAQDASETHGAYPMTEFTSYIYSEPNDLTLCVDNERTFKAVNYINLGVEWLNNAVSFNQNASWTIHFDGAPAMLSYELSASTQLTIQESSTGSGWETAFYGSAAAGTTSIVLLQPDTRYVKITVTDATVFEELCISKFEGVRADTDILYMPISNDPVNNPTEKTVFFTYASKYDLSIRTSTSDIYAEPEKLNKTVEGEFQRVAVKIYSKATSEYEAAISVQAEVGSSGVKPVQLEIPVETYKFPQKLPIQLERGKDLSKRFYFVTKGYKNTEWDAQNYAAKMQNQTGQESNQPYIHFAFDGAPSFISFVPLVATDAAEWKIEESENNMSWSLCQDPTLVDGVLKQTLTYTSHYVKVTYIGSKTEQVQLTKINIISDRSAIPNPTEIYLTEANKYTNDLSVGEVLDITSVRLSNMTISTDNPSFTISYDGGVPGQTITLSEEAFIDKEDVLTWSLRVFWNASKSVDFGIISITTIIDDQEIQLATVNLSGNTAVIGGDIFTGVKTGYELKGSFSGAYAIAGNDGTAYRPVDLSKAYDNNNKPLFDYLIIYGETTTTDGSKTITVPNSDVGSNAKTPMYIYERVNDTYQFLLLEENANTAYKTLTAFEAIKYETLRIFITGFCPYATTGYTKEDEGVWYFQGENNAKLDIYLNDCYIYSRNKTVEGRSFKSRYDGQAFSEGYVRGSGGVLVFENLSNNRNDSFDVTIHSSGFNMLKSNYGCFFELMKGMRAFQASSPIQVHLASKDHKVNSVTTITFDDKWPIDVTDYDQFERTNGFLSLRKQVNNAPSVDLGNANTIVNFMGGQVELQNAAVVSPNYKTTFAISFRSGLMAGFPMALGIGTDDVGGIVNFHDGTTTVIPMEVDVKYRDYYLMDTDANGKELTTTSCLRTPTNTFVYGGSHCMMRACEDVTSKGGAPTRNGNPLGIYKYPKIKATVEAGQTAPRGGFGEPNGVGLVKPTDIPEYYHAESVSPNTNGTADTSDDYLNFWFTTEEESSVKPEVDKMINFWKACMTEISAEYMSYGGTIGGKTMMLPNQEVKNFLYCQIDENIHNVIYAGTGEGDDRKFTYEAPVKDPTGQLEMDYLSFPPSYVGEEWQNYVETVEYIDPEHPENSTDTGDDYEITEKIYYIVPASADTWMTFTAPFNVQKLWVVETYDEEKLAKTELKKDEYDNLLTRKKSVLIEQATHNADFAAFFGVALALGRDQSFEEIYRDYLGWAMYKDNHKGTVNDYKKRGMVPLTHYDGSNFYTANYYLYKNNGLWTRNGDKFDTKWEVVGNVADNEILMHQGETYSMLFPYCTGCDVLTDEDGNIVKDENGLPIPSSVRDYWDYWSGKFLIFESTKATSENPHKIKGSKYHDALFAPANSGNGNTAVLTGNSTFAKMFSDDSVDENIYTYIPEMGNEGFDNQSNDDGYGNVTYQTIEPTVAFLIADIQAPANMVAKRVSRSGNITYVNKNNTTTGSHTPTIGGGDKLYVTGIAGGINIAVAQPQFVQVISATGVVLYNGYVTDNVNVPLPINGIYVVKGENEAQKIFF